MVESLAFIPLVFLGLTPMLLALLVPMTFLQKITTCLSSVAEEPNSNGDIGLDAKCAAIYTSKQPGITILLDGTVLLTPVLALLWGEFWFQPLLVSMGGVHSRGFIFALALLVLLVAIAFIRDERILKARLVKEGHLP